MTSCCPPVWWHSLVRPPAEPFFRSLIAARNASAFLIFLSRSHSFVRPRRRHSSAPTADLPGHRAQRRSMTAPLWGRPEGLSLTAASTVAGLGGRGPRKCAWLDGSSPLGGSMSLPGPPFSTRSSCTGRTMASGFRRRYVPNALSQAGAGRIARSSRPVPAGTASAASAANEFQLKDHVMGPALQWATGT